MTAFDRRILQSGGTTRERRTAKFDLQTLDLTRISKRLVVFTPTAHEIEQLLEAAAKKIGTVAPASTVCQVAEYNPDSFWAIGYRQSYTTERRNVSGFLAFLMLNGAGMERLIRGELDATKPNISLLVRQNEKPAGVYVWGGYASGFAAGGIPLAFEKVSSRLYADVGLYSRPATAEGRRMLETLGFQHGAEFSGALSSSLYSYPRGKSQVENNPIYDTYREGAKPNAIAIRVAHSIEDLMRIIAIRSAVYVSEQSCPYREEFDGNDFSGSHLLAYFGDEPVGCLRIRYFARFAKLERLAVRAEFRSYGIGEHLMRAGVELCRVKGYQTIYGTAQTRLINYYKKMGFRPIESKRPVRFSGFDYTEIILEVARHPRPINLETDPYVFLRKEGQWHDRGIFDPPSDAASEAASISKVTA